MFIKSKNNPATLSAAIYAEPDGRDIRSDEELYACVREHGGAEIWKLEGSKIGPRLFLSPAEFVRLWKGD